jgi:hypothetical protein
MIRLGYFCLMGFFCLSCLSQEELEKLRRENAVLKKKLEKVEQKLETAYNQSIKSRIPQAIWINGNGVVRVEQGYIYSINFEIYGKGDPKFTAEYISSRKVKPRYLLFFYNRLGECIGYAENYWKISSVAPKIKREDKPHKIEYLSGEPAYFTITFLNEDPVD